MIKDVIRFDSETQTQENFSRQYRDLYSGFRISSENQFFDPNQELFKSFVDSIRELTGVDIAGFSQNISKEKFISIEQSVKECMYIAQGMSQLYKLALEWAEVLDVQCYMTINPNDMVTQLEPIYQVTQTVHSFAVRVEEVKN